MATFLHGSMVILYPDNTSLPTNCKKLWTRASKENQKINHVVGNQVGQFVQPNQLGVKRVVSEQEDTQNLSADILNDAACHCAIEPSLRKGTSRGRSCATCANWLEPLFK